MFMECIEGLRLKLIDAIFLLNGVFDAVFNYLHELVFVEVCIYAGRNLSHQYNQQEAEELNRE